LEAFAELVGFEKVFWLVVADGALKLLEHRSVYDDYLSCSDVLYGVLLSAAKSLGNEVVTHL